MTYKILEHTADIRMKITDSSPEGLFSEALRGMMNFLKKETIVSENRTKRFLSVSSADLVSLLVDFLNEALTLCHIHKEIYSKAVFKKFSHNLIEAELTGSPVDSFDKDIKAVTYHESLVKKNAKNKWRANLIFDI